MHVISYMRVRGEDPFVVTNADADEDALRTLCADLANAGMLSVTLHSLTTQGVIVPMAMWESRNGRTIAKRSVPEVEAPEVIDAAEEDTTDTEDTTEAADEDNDDQNVYDGFCVKCRDHREFHGEVVEMANGRRRAKGNCPVCGTGISRILSNLPVSDDYDTPEDDDETDEDDEPNPDDDPDAGLEPDDDEGESANPDDDPDVDIPEVDLRHALNRETHTSGRNRGTHLSCECGEWDKWVTKKTEKAGRAEFEKHVDDSTISVEVSAPEGTPVEEIAEAVSEQAEELAAPIPEFSDEDKAAVNGTVLRSKTAKAAKKAVPKGLTADEQKARDMKVKTCPQCAKKVPVIERAGIEIFTVHPNADKGLDRCSGSTTAV